jgi:hypothetical protein
METVYNVVGVFSKSNVQPRVAIGKECQRNVCVKSASFVAGGVAAGHRTAFRMQFENTP